MAIADSKTLITPSDLLAMPDETSFELVEGLLVERNTGSISSWVGGRIHHCIGNYLKINPVGWVWPADNGIQCFPDSPNTVRRPDVTFVRLGRLPGERFPEGYIRIAPDLVVEVLSPNDLAYEVDTKVRDFVAAGVRLIWIVNPDTRTIRIHRADGSFDWLTEVDELAGEDVLPGFRCPLLKLFPPQVAS